MSSACLRELLSSLARKSAFQFSSAFKGIWKLHLFLPEST